MLKWNLSSAFTAEDFSTVFSCPVWPKPRPSPNCTEQENGKCPQNYYSSKFCHTCADRRLREFFYSFSSDWLWCSWPLHQQLYCHETETAYSTTPQSLACPSPYWGTHHSFSQSHIRPTGITLSPCYSLLDAHPLPTDLLVWKINPPLLLMAFPPIDLMTAPLSSLPVICSLATMCTLSELRKPKP